MAEGLTHAIGDALLSLLEFTWPDIRPKVERVAARVAEALRPEPPLVLRTDDGEVVTGFVVLDRGRALLFFGIRSTLSSSSAQEPRIRTAERPFEPKRYPDHEQSYDDQVLWPRPYGR